MNWWWDQPTGALHVDEAVGQVPLGRCVSKVMKILSTSSGSFLSRKTPFIKKPRLVFGAGLWFLRFFYFVSATTSASPILNLKAIEAGSWLIVTSHTEQYTTALVR